MAISPLSSDIIRQHKGVSFTGITTVFICYDGSGKILLTKRSQNTRDEQGRWEPGGGGLKHGQAIEANMKRELMEELGLEPIESTFVGYYDAFRALEDGTPTHWLAMCFAVKVDPAKASIKEPDMIDELGWFELDKLPSPIHSQFANYFAKYEESLRKIIGC